MWLFIHNLISTMVKENYVCKRGPWVLVITKGYLLTISTMATFIQIPIRGFEEFGQVQ